MEIVQEYYITNLHFLCIFRIKKAMSRRGRLCTYDEATQANNHNGMDSNEIVDNEDEGKVDQDSENPDEGEEDQKTDNAKNRIPKRKKRR